MLLAVVATLLLDQQVLNYDDLAFCLQLVPLISDRSPRCKGHLIGDASGWSVAGNGLGAWSPL